MDTIEKLRGLLNEAPQELKIAIGEAIAKANLTGYLYCRDCGVDTASAAQVAADDNEWELFADELRGLTR